MERKIKNDEVLNNEQPQSQTEKQSGIFSSEAFHNLAKTARYMKIMSIVYFLGTFLIVIGMIINMADAKYFVSSYSIAASLVNVLCAIIVFCLGIDLWSTGKAYKNIAIKSPEEQIETMENAIYFQLRYWRMTIRTLIAFVALSLLFFMIGNRIY